MTLTLQRGLDDDLKAWLGLRLGLTTAGLTAGPKVEPDEPKNLCCCRIQKPVAGDAVKQRRQTGPDMDTDVTK